jgi:hypothetical protein
MFKPITPARQTQLAIAAAFLSFGAVWLLAPDWLAQLFARDPTLHLPVVTLALGGLGAHALAAGLFAAFARFKSWTYPGFAVSLLPVFAADYWLFAKSGAVNEMTFVHAGGMFAVLALCVRGFRLLQRDENAAPQPA